MKITTKLSIFALAGVYLSACASLVDPYSEEAAVQRLVANEGNLQQNVDPDFEGDAYDQVGKKVVCKKMGVTGSRISHYTVCRTEAEWQATKEFASGQIKRIVARSASAGSH